MPVGDEEDFWAKPVDSQAVRVELLKKGVIDAYQIRVFQAGAPLFPAWFNLNRENPFPERQTSNCLSISLDQIRPGETLIFSIGRCSPGNPNVNFNLGLEETVGGIFEGVTSHLQALLRVKFNDKGYPVRFEVLDLGTNPTRAIGAGQQKAHDALAIRKFTYW